MAKLHSNADYDTGDTAFLLISTMLVFFMIPGLALLYSGLTRRKSALSVIWLCLVCGSIAICQWWFWGYSLALSTTATNKFIGNLHNFALRNAMGGELGETYPEILFAGYQGMFCALTCAILMGGIAERARLWPAALFTFIWTTLVYCPLACWTWGPNGWGTTWGVLDYAGGVPVEIGSGVGGISLAFVVGRRREKLLINFRPHNVSMVALGTSMLWFGWLGFNGGSAFGANLRAAYAIWNTNITAAFAAFSWSVLDYRLERKWSMVAVCSGAVSGLVAATPASGNIPMWASVILGVVAGICCNLSTGIKYLINVDDSLDTFAEHGMAGIIGLLANGVFAADWVIGLDGSTEHDGGWVTRNWKQMYIQVAFLAAAAGYTCVVTILIGFVINYIPGCKWKVTEEQEQEGIDASQVGEFAYDYVEIRRDYWNALPEVVDAQINEAETTPHSKQTSAQPLESPGVSSNSAEKTQVA